MQQLQPNFNTGANSLTSTLKTMIRGVSDKGVVIDFGKINSDYSLTTNSFPEPIPKDSYNVCRSLLYHEDYPLTEDVAGTPKKLPKDTKISIPDGAHMHNCGCHHCLWTLDGQHYHWVELPKKMRRLKPGDKVLVACVANEAVVIDIVFNAKYLGTDDEPDWT